MNNKFKLIIDGDSVRQFTIETLRDGIYNLKDDTDSFIVLEPKIPINNSIYLQAILLEDGKYSAETRLVFGSTDNFKHYSKIYNSAEELYEIFALYYLEMQLPNIKLWIDESHDFMEDNTEVEMVKLYKTHPKETYYFEVWINDDSNLTVHTGYVGDIGITEDIICDDEGDLPIQAFMQQVIQAQYKKGYRTISLTELIIQYTYNPNLEVKQIVSEQKDIETVLNECLGWTGNGHCEGGDAEAGLINLYCYVVDKDIALDTILKVLSEEKPLPNLKIGYADEKTEEYIMLYPQKGSFELI